MPCDDGRHEDRARAVLATGLPMPGHHVVAGARRIAVVAAGDVVEIGGLHARRGAAASACGPSIGVKPSATRSWSATAIRPAQQGDETLVPPTWTHGVQPPPSYES